MSSFNWLRMAPVVLMLFGVTAANANLLENGDFSQWDSPTSPAGWIVEDTIRARIERSDSLSHSVPYSCKITRLVSGTGNNYGVRQFVPVTPGRVYTLSAWYYDDDINARGGIVITWCRGDSSAIRSTSVVYTDSGIRTWQRLVKSETAPDSTVYGKCMLRVYGFTGSPSGGVVYADDAEFYEGGGGIAEDYRNIREEVKLRVISLNNGVKKISLVPGMMGSGRLDIYDITGSPRVQIYRGLFSGAEQSFIWDGTDHNRRKLPAGVYFAAFQNGQTTPLVEKFILEK